MSNTGIELHLDGTVYDCIARPPAAPYIAQAEAWRAKEAMQQPPPAPRRTEEEVAAEFASRTPSGNLRLKIGYEVTLTQFAECTWDNAHYIRSAIAAAIRADREGR